MIQNATMRFLKRNLQALFHLFSMILACTTHMQNEVRDRNLRGMKRHSARNTMRCNDMPCAGTLLLSDSWVWPLQLSIAINKFISHTTMHVLLIQSTTRGKCRFIDVKSTRPALLRGSTIFDREIRRLGKFAILRYLFNSSNAQPACLKLNSRLF